MKAPKMLKVFYMGEPLRNIYPHATRFQVFKYKLARATRKLVIASFIVGAIYGAYNAGLSSTEPVTVQASKEVDVSDTRFKVRIDNLKNGVANQLMKCESAGYSESDGIVIFDSNEKGSFGQFQFQKNTVIHFYKVLYGKVITPKEAVLIALDTDKARSLAIDVMFKTPNKAGKDWVNCTKKYDLDKQIDLIKKMEVL